MHSGDEFVSPAEGSFHPLPANFQRALASKPMWIDPPALALFNNFRALGDSRQRRESQHQAQPLPCLRRRDEGGLELEAIRLVIQEVLFNVKSSPIFFKGLHISRLITYDEPIFFAILASCQCQMHRTIMNLRNIDVMPKSCFP
jgi:hypothetical protein